MNFDFKNFSLDFCCIFSGRQNRKIFKVKKKKIEIEIRKVKLERFLRPQFSTTFWNRVCRFCSTHPMNTRLSAFDSPDAGKFFKYRYHGSMTHKNFSTALWTSSISKILINVWQRRRLKRNFWDWKFSKKNFWHQKIIFFKKFLKSILMHQGCQKSTFGMCYTLFEPYLIILKQYLSFLVPLWLTLLTNAY